ncbi:hypothetical protein F511_19610 [Dorcoceras hygrometricum]|uniref:Uncharacterized protein n=1 Tax=Dorcoceras hygrometricum TaxID=472368 RepID=A0A2Z7CJ03_9LAMI|nr:hypothetical protein F511_19610 [Dorcoceras hygrometricum]
MSKLEADQIGQELRAEAVRCRRSDQTRAAKRSSAKKKIRSVDQLERISSGKFSSGNQIAVEQLKQLRAESKNEIARAKLRRSKQLRAVQRRTKQLRAEQRRTEQIRAGQLRGSIVKISQRSKMEQHRPDL